MPIIIGRISWLAATEEQLVRPPRVLGIDNGDVIELATPVRDRPHPCCAVLAGLCGDKVFASVDINGEVRDQQTS